MPTPTSKIFPARAYVLGIALAAILGFSTATSATNHCQEDAALNLEQLTETFGAGTDAARCVVGISMALALATIADGGLTLSTFGIPGLLACAKVIQSSYEVFSEQAPFYLGLLHQHGIDVPYDGDVLSVEKNLSLAKQHYEKAAELCHSDAMHKLGLWYKDGLHDDAGEVVVKKDIVSARDWFAQSASIGNEKAQVALDKLVAREHWLKWYVLSHPIWSAIVVLLVVAGIGGGIVFWRRKKVKPTDPPNPS